MIQWEYNAPYIFGDLDMLMEKLAELGKQGWEVIQIERLCSDGGQRVFLKRMLRPPDPPMLVPEGFDLRPGAVNRVG